MFITYKILLLCFMLESSFGAPAPVTPAKSNSTEHEIKNDLEDIMEYHKYLQEVVQALESDPDFRERLEKANDEDVRSGRIAEQLDFVDHNVRTKLDEIKRRELERMRHLLHKKMELTNTIDGGNSKELSNDHLDHSNPHTFEIEDLKRLIKKTTEDLEAADKQRKEEFKEYEMQKEFEQHQKLESLDEKEKKELLHKIEAEKDAKKHHAPIHHPGSKQQLEEVWEKQDHMDNNFDPRAFFMMHDIDSNGVWDAEEVKALFIKELDKMYTPDGPNKDRHERAEEMERMREHVFSEVDLNRDGLIDFNEFMIKTKASDFNQDSGWQSIDENQIYSQSEYQEYERRRLDEIKYLQQHGLVDAHGRPLPGAEHQIHQALQRRQYEQHAYQNAQYQMPVIPPNQHHPQGYMPNGNHPGYAQGSHPVPAQNEFHPQQPNLAHSQPSYQNINMDQNQYHPANNLPQNQAQNQMPMQNQVPVQNQMPIQNQVPVQNQMPIQNQVPVQNQMPIQNQVPVHNQMPIQNQVPIQNQMPVQNQVPVQNQMPPQNQVPHASQNNHPNNQVQH